VAVSFLDIVPKATTETVTIEATGGPVDVELRGVPFSILGDIAGKHPAFAKLIEGGSGSLTEAADAMPALIAAGLGHAGDPAYEDKAKTLSAADILKMAGTIMRLTFPATVADPLSPAPEAPRGDGADVVHMRQTSLRP